MKKISLTVIISAAFLITGQKVAAQSSYGGEINIVHLGTGFISEIKNSETATTGYTSIYPEKSVYSSQVLPLSVAYDKGITDLFSLGGYLGFESYSVSQGNIVYLPFPSGTTNYTWSWNESLIILAFRASFHFRSSEHIDPYTGLLLGSDILSSGNYSSDNSAYPPRTDTLTAGYAFGAYVGMNYYFSNTFGAYCEISYGNVLSVLNVGLTVRF